MSDNILAKRYQIIDKLGEGGSGITYKALDLHSSEKVAIKVLSLVNIDNWKKIDYFEREVKILQQLDHPKIPRYIDYFVSDSSKDSYHQIASGESFKDLLEKGIQPDQFYLVQEYIEGKSFFQLVENGWKADEQEAKKIATQILYILVYLQKLIPPITHRDIKPQNIIYTENKEVFLVDFGAVQDRVRQTTVGSSVVGTYGYMAPEQFRGGKTYPSTDLYGLGTTLIYLLTGKHPSNFPQKKLKIDFKNQVNLSSDLSKWLDKLIEPFPEKRLSSAQIALDILKGSLKLEDQISNYIEKPRYSSIKLAKTSEQLTVHIPCALNRNNWKYGTGLLAIFWYAVIFLILLILSISTYSIYLKLFCLIYTIILIVQFSFLNLNKIYFYAFKGSFSLLVLPFILTNFHLAYVISFFILVAEMIGIRISKNMIRELFFDTSLIINRKYKIDVQQNLSFLLKQSQLFVNKQYKIFLDNNLKLLNKQEKQWLNYEIENHFNNR